MRDSHTGSTGRSWWLEGSDLAVKEIHENPWEFFAANLGSGQKPHVGYMSFRLLGITFGLSLDLLSLQLQGFLQKLRMRLILLLVVASFSPARRSIGCASFSQVLRCEVSPLLWFFGPLVNSGPSRSAEPHRGGCGDPFCCKGGSLVVLN